MMKLKVNRAKIENYTLDEIQQDFPIRIDHGIKFYSRSAPDFSNIENWCIENLEYDVALLMACVYLKTDEDAMAFKLRWL